MTSHEQRGAVAYPDVTLAVIAGGRGQRLGHVAKGLLELEGRTVLERLLELGHRFAEVLLVANEPEPYARFSLRTVSDVVPGRGAPGGVHTSLVHARTPWVLAVACDMPFVSPAALDTLLASRSPQLDALCFQVSRGVEPLLALYRRELADSWGQALDMHPSLRALLSSCRSRILPEDSLRAVDPALRSVLNINTPEDLARHAISLPHRLHPA